MRWILDLGVLSAFRAANQVQMMLYRSSGELVLEDSPDCFDPSAKSGAVVVVDIDTGQELGRASINETGTMGMFLCPVKRMSQNLIII